MTSTAAATDPADVDELEAAVAKVLEAQRFSEEQAQERAEFEHWLNSFRLAVDSAAHRFNSSLRPEDFPPLVEAENKLAVLTKHVNFRGVQATLDDRVNTTFTSHCGNVREILGEVISILEVRFKASYEQCKALEAERFLAAGLVDPSLAEQSPIVKAAAAHVERLQYSRQMLSRRLPDRDLFGAVFSSLARYIDPSYEKTSPLPEGYHG